MKNDKPKQVTIFLSEELHKKIKIHAVESGSTMTTILLKWIESGAKKEIKG